MKVSLGDYYFPTQQGIILTTPAVEVHFFHHKVVKIIDHRHGSHNAQSIFFNALIHCPISLATSVSTAEFVMRSSLHEAIFGEMATEGTKTKPVIRFHLRNTKWFPVFGYRDPNKRVVVRLDKSAKKHEKLRECF